MICGLGCDACEVARMEAILKENPRFLARCFTAEEQAYIGARTRAAETAAGLFAAKEALLKALGCGLGGLPMAQIGIRHDAQGAPYYEINDALCAALQTCGAERAWLSISHDGGIAMAVAVLEGEA